MLRLFSPQIDAKNVGLGEYAIKDQMMNANFDINARSQITSINAGNFGVGLDLRRERAGKRIRS